MTLQKSSAVHIQALYPADGILPGCSSKPRLLVINLASVRGGQLANSPTAQSLDRYALSGDKLEILIKPFESNLIITGLFTFKDDSKRDN